MPTNEHVLQDGLMSQLNYYGAVPHAAMRYGADAEAGSVLIDTALGGTAELRYDAHGGVSSIVHNPGQTPERSGGVNIAAVVAYMAIDMGYRRPVASRPSSRHTGSL